MINRTIKIQIVNSVLGLCLFIFVGCEESLPLNVDDIDGTWYTDKGISNYDETIWIFRAWNFVYSTDELDRYGGFKSEALKYQKQFSGIVVKRAERNGVRVGNTYLGVWELDSAELRSSMNILWLSSDGVTKSDQVHFALDKKGVVNLYHNDLIYREYGFFRALIESIITNVFIVTIIACVLSLLLLGILPKLIDFSLKSSAENIKENLYYPIGCIIFITIPHFFGILSGYNALAFYCYIVNILICIITMGGSYQHTTKSGQRDKRFKTSNNTYTYNYSYKTREYFMSVLYTTILSIGIYIGLDFFTGWGNFQLFLNYLANY